MALAALVAGCGGGPKSDGRFELAFQRTVGERTSVWVARLDGTHGRLAVRNAVLPNVAPLRGLLGRRTRATFRRATGSRSRAHADS